MFNGFSPETVDFLWGIRLNNNREWFLEHKKNYTTYLYEPMKELGKFLYEPYMDIPNVQVKVSRIYKDARMHPVVPYKESLWICIRRDQQWWAENPCQFFEITPDGISYGMLFWQPKTQALVDFRNAIAQKPEQFLDLINRTEEATGCSVTAAEYKRPKPCDDPRLERFYKWKGSIACIKEEPFSEATFGPDLAYRVRDMIVKLDELTDFLAPFGIQ